jgi:hypothetical protein
MLGLLLATGGAAWAGSSGPEQVPEQVILMPIGAESGARQAERLAQDALNRRFSQSTETVFSVKVLGERDGQIVPILTIQVARGDWQKDAQVRTWARYFGSALLGSGRDRLSPPAAPIAAASNRRLPVGEGEPNYYNNSSN